MYRITIEQTDKREDGELKWNTMYQQTVSELNTASVIMAILDRSHDMGRSLTASDAALLRGDK